MTEINQDTYRPPVQGYLASQGIDEFSDADLDSLIQRLQGDGPTEAELQEQFDKNFETMSYLFMKEIYAHADEQTYYQ